MMEILKNNLFKRGIESGITFTKVSGDVSQYILRSGSLWSPNIFYVLEAYGTH